MGIFSLRGFLGDKRKDYATHTLAKPDPSVLIGESPRDGPAPSDSGDFVSFPGLSPRGALRLDGMTPGEARLAAAVRIATGAIFVAEGAAKLAGDFVRGSFARSAEGMARESWPFWKSFLQSVVVPRAGVFGWGFALAELAVGIGLLLGLATRAAAGGGAVLMIAILLGQSYVPGGN